MKSQRSQDISSNSTIPWAVMSTSDGSSYQILSGLISPDIVLLLAEF
jgi:hypothetical protein